MKIAIDAMGGDKAPNVIVDGAMDYVKDNPSIEIVLVGLEDVLKPLLVDAPSNITIHHAPEVIKMKDKISALKEKPNDSMNVSSQLLKEGKVDAQVLCGNTACSVAAAQLHLRRIKGVKRAAILTPLPTNDGLTWVVDCGANAVGKPEHLVQFAQMADIFLKNYYDMKAPKVGVLSIGTEDEKGIDLTKETLASLREVSDINCVGNVEGNNLTDGTIDIAVCDGFTGNIALKTLEGVVTTFNKVLKQSIQAKFLSKIAYLFMKPSFKMVKDKLDWRIVGGCLLVGVNGITIIGHGKSDRLAVYHAIKQAARCVDKEVLKHLTETF